MLGAVIAFHPRLRGRFSGVDEVEAPRTFIIYAVVGAIIGTLVRQYGSLVGLVIFGIGGLMRFRTNLGSATRTGQVILVTLVGLCVGLGLPHVAVVATGFSFVLLYLLAGRPVYRMTVKGLDPLTLGASAETYRALLEQAGCEVMAEDKNFQKQLVMLLFRPPSQVDRRQLEDRFAGGIPEKLRGSVDWEVR